jgi:hypothetical protein
LLPWWTVALAIMTMPPAIRVFVILDVNCMMLGRDGKLLKKVMDPVWRGKDQKKQNNDGRTEIYAAPLS